MESGGDRDVFRFATGDGTLRVYSNGPTDTYGTLLDAGGRTLASNDDSGRRANFNISAQVAAGVHYVQVRHSSSTGTGAYTLSVEFESDDAAAAVPTVTIAADASSVGEGADADFHAHPIRFGGVADGERQRDGDGVDDPRHRAGHGDVRQRRNHRGVERRDPGRHR